MKTLLAPVLCAASMFAPLAAASISSTFGACTQIAAPLVADFPTLVGPGAEVWNERQNTNGLVIADLTTNSGNSGFPTPGSFQGIYDSHFIHFTGLSPNQAVGGVIFSGNIVAVAWNDLNLDLTDAIWGAPVTTYPTGQFNRGMNSLGFLSISGATLNFDFRCFSPVLEIEQVRVWTVIPAPGAATLAGLGGLFTVGRRRRSHPA